MAVKICIIGAAGRMGKNIAEAVYNSENAEAAGAVDRKGSDAVGQNLYETAGCGKGGPVITDDILESTKNADVIIDFTGAEPTYNNLPLYEKAGKPVVIGSTGFSDEQKKAVEKLSEKVTLLPLLIFASLSFSPRYRTDVFNYRYQYRNPHQQNRKLSKNFYLPRHRPVACVLTDRSAELTDIGNSYRFKQKPQIIRVAA